MSPNPVPPPTGSSTITSTSRSWCDLAGDLGFVDAGDVLTIDDQLARPLAQHPAPPPEVAGGAEVEPGVRHRGDAQRPGGPVGAVQRDRPSPQTSVVVVEVQRLGDRRKPADLTVGQLLLGLRSAGLEALTDLVVVEGEQPVP